MQRAYIGRFAPSPSGPLHFGSLVAALGSYLDARHHGGHWLLRMEDIDPPRERPGAARDILRTLERFGFEWDGEVLYQSRRDGAYREQLERLLRHHHAFACRCSRREVAAAAHNGTEGPLYPGTCRRDPPPQPRPGLAVRLCSDHPEAVAFHDRVCGPIAQWIARDIGDFVIRRAEDGIFAYQLAVVIDDAGQGVNQVVRGADLLLSTPRQILLQRLLGLPTPRYAHLPLVLGEDGRKLSKQSAARPVRPERPLEALLAAYRFLGQRFPDAAQPATPEEFWPLALEQWEIARVPVSGIN
ncbi:MAG: tRNA glutamyl-Q(34) synthetase GluQRS [gamma proteobacterium symbiont of Phacoides pectinatus]